MNKYQTTQQFDGRFARVGDVVVYATLVTTRDKETELRAGLIVEIARNDLPVILPVIDDIGGPMRYGAGVLDFVATSTAEQVEALQGSWTWPLT